MRIRSVAVLLGLCLTAASCSSSGSGSAGNPGGSGGAGSAAASSTTTPPTASGGATTATGGGATSGGITLTGAFHAVVSVNLCSGSTASIAVKVDGDSQKYLGTISATNFVFVGPEAADYSLTEGEARPTVSGTSFTVKNTTLIDLISKKSVVANGTVSCP